MTNKELILVFIGLLSLIHCLYFKKENIIYLTIFLLPIGVWGKTNMIPIGLSGILIWSIWFSFVIRRNSIGNKIINSNVISSNLRWLYVFIFLGAITGVINLNTLESFTKDSQFAQIFSLSLSLLTIVFFIKILVNYRDDFIFQRKIKFIFTISIFLHLIPLLAEKIGVLNSLVALSYTTFEDSLIQTEVARFSGLFGDYELIVDYCLMIVALTLSNSFLYKRNKLISILTILSSLFIGILSGTRSFLIILPLFFMLFFLLGWIYSINRTKFTILFLTVSVLTYLFVIKFSSQITVFERLFEAKRIYSSTGDLNEASNRRFDKTIYYLLENIMIIGNGSLEFNEIGGDEMVSHNLLMHTYSRYGIPGLFLILVLFFKSIISSLKCVLKAKSKIQKTEGIILVALLISLFVQEMKISAIRYQCSMLIYTFLFVLVYFYLYQFKTRKVNG